MNEDLPQPSPRKYQYQFNVFVVLWAIAACFQAWYQLPWPIEAVPGAAAGVTVLLAVFVIGRPSSTGSLALLAGWQVIWGLYLMPTMADHRFLALLVDISILISYCMAAMVHSKRGVTVDDVYAGFAPTVRWILVLSLLFSVLSKFNTGFTDLDASCAVNHWKSFGQHLSPHLASAKWTYSLVVSAILIVESVILIGLLLPKIRAFAVGLGSVYYLSCALSGICCWPDTAFTMFALLYLMTSEDVTTIITWGGQRPLAFQTVPLTGVIAVATAIIALAASAIAMRTEDAEQMKRFYDWLMSGVMLSCGIIWCGVLLWALYRSQGSGPIRLQDLVVANPLFYLVLAATLLSGASPYLGWKTRLAFTQYSNLCTENNASNHYFIPQYYFGDYQTNLVRVLDSSDAQLKKVADRGLLITKFDLVRLASRAPEASLKYERIDGEEISIDKLGEVADLSVPPAWWQVKLLTFRPYSPDGCRCLR